MLLSHVVCINVTDTTQQSLCRFFYLPNRHLFFITFTVLRPTRRLQLADHVSNFVSPIGGGVASKWPAGDDTAS